MSKRETPMTVGYWKSVGGTLIEEYCLVDRGKDCGGRWVDGLILPDEPTRRAPRGERVSLDGKRVMLVQTKAGRLGMYLMGQVLFSRELVLARFKPLSVESIALCSQGDEILRPMLEAHDGCRVIVLSPQPDAGAS